MRPVPCNTATQVSTRNETRNGDAEDLSHLHFQLSHLSSAEIMFFSVAFLCHMIVEIILVVILVINSCESKLLYKHYIALYYYYIIINEY